MRNPNFHAISNSYRTIRLFSDSCDILVTHGRGTRSSFHPKRLIGKPCAGSSEKKRGKKEKQLRRRVVLVDSNREAHERKIVRTWCCKSSSSSTNGRVLVVRREIVFHNPSRLKHLLFNHGLISGEQLHSLAVGDWSVEGKKKSDNFYLRIRCKPVRDEERIPARHQIASDLLPHRAHAQISLRRLRRVSLTDCLFVWAVDGLVSTEDFLDWIDPILLSHFQKPVRPHWSTRFIGCNPEGGTSSNLTLVYRPVRSINLLSVQSSRKSTSSTTSKTP